MRSQFEIANHPAVRVLEQGEDGGTYNLKCLSGPGLLPTQLFVIASWGAGWDHVSVSAAKRCPSWDEMEWVKRIFFDGRETAMQLHVPPAEYINCCDRCLHLWRPHDGTIPRPPAWMVGPQNKA